ncbi:TrbG/VirB9 family P-type conjugative transfer protein [Brevundimonas sp. SL130]|uniref:TrbG/VirB9 family P-type conjugative transfer protein n=1 Tax=Brevundimonas sp. SL130 TaxID=2995143 RepID=UPI00226C834D|nr:TrbG/VirB9 family P-type conjugative transfer protein [Brevundimonas sp. SL130]WAC59778.1 TrbG/VirB9 family P-type conjugative transfer protein [Brevundimonas sp. SL130]
MIRIAALLVVLAFGSEVSAQTAAAAPSDPRIQTMPYDAGRVVPLRIAPRHQLTVIFGADERIENVAIGDSEAWQVTVNNRGDSLFLKSLQTGGATNMTVITDARVYSFELTPAANPGFDVPYTLRFVYPERPQADQTPPPTPGVGRYRLTGARGARPAAIDDDGVRTYIEWKPQQPLPAVFSVDERGAETLLQGQTRDDRYVIDAVHPTILFRLDRQVARATRQAPREDRR